MWGPNHFPRTGTTEALTNLVDLLCTFLNLAGVSTPQEFQGTDLTPLLRRESEAVQDAVLVELRATETTLNQHTLITERHKIVVYKHTDEGELYDLQIDPDQYVNLWNEKPYLRSELLLRLARIHMEREANGPPRMSFARLLLL